ncbi:hypothetical protein [Nocardia amikacinitolerans]|uniref:hypothetical protein n=1 Tax=Nocardia amikacinitolerans TaxID=756689 RepID=UPI000BE2F8E4|nr:hypothetical protein [Nocardia amikacinitolerans]
MHWLECEFIDRIGKLDAEGEPSLPDWRTWHFKLDDNPVLSGQAEPSVQAGVLGAVIPPLHPRALGGRRRSLFDSWDDDHIIDWATLLLMPEPIAGGSTTAPPTPPTHMALLGVGVLYAVDEYRYDPTTISRRKTDAELSTELAKEQYRGVDTSRRRAV